MVQNLSSDRIVCLVDGCHRSSRNKQGFEEWICSKHWLAIPKDQRKLYASLKRRLRRGKADVQQVYDAWVLCKMLAYENAWSA